MLGASGCILSLGRQGPLLGLEEGEGVPFSVGLHSKVTQTGAFTHWATFPSEAPALKGSTFPNNVKS